MNKKQVGALLKVMSKDIYRPILMTAKVEKFRDELHLVVTDGFYLASIKLDENASELEGKLIRREAIEKWYKLATGKSRLNGSEVVQVASDDYAQYGSYQEGDYPKWQSLIPAGEPEPQASMKFNADLFKTIQDLDGEGALEVKFYGELAPMVFESERGFYLVMPMKG